MLAVIFSIGPVRYALEASTIVEVLPLASLTPVPALPPEIAGLLNFRGVVVPVIDLNRLLLGTACPALLSSRILLTHYPLPDGRARILGLRVARAEVQPVDMEKPLLSSELKTPPWLGKVMIRDGEMVQIIQPNSLLTDTVRALLFPPQQGSDGEMLQHADSIAD